MWQFWKRATGHSVDLKMAGGVRLRCYPDSTSASLMLYCAGMPDYDGMRFMRHYLRPGDGFIDVGANVGVYTLYAAALVGRAGAIDSFEPASKAAARLRENLRLNDLTTARVHEVAVGAVPSSVRFSVDRDTVNAIELEEPPSASGTIEVPCVRLDDALRSGRYAMGKMDIEGAEPLALFGARRLLEEANPPVWLLEMNGGLRRYGFTEKGLQDWLLERHYELTLYDADSRTFSFPARPWELRENVLAVAHRH